MKLHIFVKKIGILLLCSWMASGLFGQSRQVINPEGGASKNFDDGLKIVVNTNGKLSVYRGNRTQYYSGFLWPAGGDDGVNLVFRFSRGTSVYNSTSCAMTTCSTTPAIRNGNNWTTSMSGYVTSSISKQRFYVTINFTYTHPNNYFYVDYYVRAPHTDGYTNPETVHIYLYHDAYIKGSDSSRGMMVTNSTGQFVGDYRLSTDNSSTCADRYSDHAVSPSCHGFKVSNKFRSYYSGAYSTTYYFVDNYLLLSSNAIMDRCHDDVIAVETTVGPLSKGQVDVKRVMHGYGDVQGEFDSTPVIDPTLSAAPSSPVQVNFSADSFSEIEGNNTHVAGNIQIEVGGGTLVQDQICNFTATNGTAAQNTDYTYVKGFTIPAGDYTIPKTLVLNNFNIIGNTICQADRSFSISIDTEECNDLILIGSNRKATVTIVDDDAPTVDLPPNDGPYCPGMAIPATEWVFSGNTPGATYEWSATNAAGIGLPVSSGTGNIPAFTTINATNAAITSTVTVTPRKDACSGTPITFSITVLPEKMYWNRNATNSNWNDPANWTDETGTVPVNAVPTNCSEVYIPGNAANYPSLDTVSSPRGTYGDPACDEICFHFGAEIAKPHLLKYSKAYVQYNFGYYDASYNFVTTGDLLSSEPMKRGRWYALAAPLKKIASGDFGVGGYPHTWQQPFVRTTMTDGDFAGIWKAPDGNNAVELNESQGYAISVWVGEYLPGKIGEGDGYHTNLNALKGIFEMPYFENQAISALHRIHSYDGSKSSFQYYYFNYPDLPLIRTDSLPAGTITRNGEAYRFIFDDMSNLTVDGKSQPTFVMELPANEEVMIGNPFMSNFDFNEFYRVNSNRLDHYYRLYANNNFVTYDVLAGSQTLSRYIAPLQAFFVATKGNGPTVQLLMPPDMLSVTKPNNKLRSAVDEGLEDVLYVSATNDDGDGYLTLSFADSRPGNVYTLFTKDYPNVPHLYAKDGSTKNSVQFTGGYDVTVPVGIWCNKPGEVKLDFHNLDGVHASSLVLVDKVLNKSVDLLKTDHYKFTNEGHETAHDRFELRVGGKIPTAINNLVGRETKVSIRSSEKTLYVRSNEGIDRIAVVNAQGQQVLTVSDVKSDEYAKELAVAPGVYIVKVKTKSGYTETGKVVVN